MKLVLLVGASMLMAGSALAGGPADGPRAPGSSANASARAQATGGAGGYGGNGGAGGLGGASAAFGGGASAGGGSVTQGGALVLPGPAGGQCGIVGFGVLAQPNGGGGFGPWWESSNCRATANAALMASWGDVDQARAYLRKNFSEIDDSYSTVSVVVPVVVPVKIPDYCATASAYERRRHPECQK